MENFDELDFTKIETPEDASNYLKEKMGVEYLLLQERLTKCLLDKAEELTQDFSNIAPHGDYSKLIEDNEGMAEFMKTEAAKPENWEITELRVEKATSKMPAMLECSFLNKIVDDGRTLEGYVFLSITGTIRHAFVQGNGKG